MIEGSQIGSIMGAPAVGPDGDKVGTVEQVFADPASGAPRWATVHTGFLGRRETFVPLDGATFDRETLHLAFDKETVREAPRFDTEEPLTPEAEAELLRHYAVAPDAAGSPNSADAPDAATGVASDARPAQDSEAADAGAEFSRDWRIEQGEASGTAPAEHGVDGDSGSALLAEDSAAPATSAPPAPDGPRHRA